MFNNTIPLVTAAQFAAIAASSTNWPSAENVTLFFNTTDAKIYALKSDGTSVKTAALS